MELLANRDVHNYNTRNRDMLKLPLAAKIGISRECDHSLKDCNNLDKDTRNTPDILNFKFSLLFVFQL